MWELAFRACFWGGCGGDFLAGFSAELLSMHLCAGASEVKGIAVDGHTLAEEKSNYQRLGLIDATLYRWELIDVTRVAEADLPSLRQQAHDPTIYGTAHKKAFCTRSSGTSCTTQLLSTSLWLETYRNEVGLSYKHTFIYPLGVGKL